MQPCLQLSLADPQIRSGWDLTGPCFTKPVSVVPVRNYLVINLGLIFRFPCKKNRHLKCTTTCCSFQASASRGCSCLAGRTPRGAGGRGRGRFPGEGAGLLAGSRQPPGSGSGWWPRPVAVAEFVWLVAPVHRLRVRSASRRNTRKGVKPNLAGRIFLINKGPGNPAFL